jgi:NADH-quinone oxidoreductase subunit E
MSDSKKPRGKKSAQGKSPSPAAAAASQPAAQGVWAGSSKAMFERMIKEVPESLQDVFRAKLMDVLSQKAKGGPYQESHVTEIVNEIVPEPFKSSILKGFATMGGVDISVVEGVVASFPGGQESVPAILHALRGQFGYVPEEALRVVSQKKNVFMSTLYRLVTSFQAFPTASPKKYTVSVCDGTGCHLKGSGPMLKKLEEKVSAPDGDITLEKVRCLGCCDLSPAVLVNGELYSGDDAQAKISEMLGE